MSDLVVDSSVVAKWVLPEADSAKAPADKPLFNAIHADFPRIVLLRDFP